MAVSEGPEGKHSTNDQYRGCDGNKSKRENKT